MYHPEFIEALRNNRGYKKEASRSAGPSSSTKRSLFFAQDRLLIRGLEKESPSGKEFLQLIK
jgi:hypothetical protein